MESNLAAIALGSNLGDRFFNIELALRLLELPQHVLQDELPEDASIDIVDTGFLYETSPMYVTDQPAFINSACLVNTNLEPFQLLRVLKQVEAAVGRIPSKRNGPRAVDLDILFYGDQTIDTRPLEARADLSNLEGQLVVPHPRILEREFVLRPLNDMIPDYIHPVAARTIAHLLDALEEEDPSMCRVIPFPRYPIPMDVEWSFSPVPVVPDTSTYWTYPIVGKKKPSKVPRRTHIMSTLNATPDSFSDGATHNTLPTALEYAQKSVKDRVSIVDIGGYSTRPGAAFVTTEKEIDRILPIVKAIRNDTSPQSLGLSNIPLSVDTFRWEVAEASIQAGVNCINDVYAFTGPDVYPPTDLEARRRADESMVNMKRVARAYAVPVVLMHSRGDAGKNKDYSMYLNGGKGSVLRGVQVELGEKIEAIVLGKGGIRRWMVIVDPGIGFSKTVEGNLELLRNAALTVGDVFIDEGSRKRRNPLRGFPQLIGPSRKSFLGSILTASQGGRETAPKERVWATASAVTCAVQQGALVVRIHDTEEMLDIVSVADAIWKTETLL